MNRLYLVILAAALGMIVTGCMTRYTMDVTTYLGDKVPFPDPSESVKVAIVTKSSPDEPLLAAEVKRKIEYLVRQRGFGVSTIDDADYILSTFFSIDEGPTLTETRLVYEPGSKSTTYINTSSGQWAWGRTRQRGHFTQEPYSYACFKKHLGMTLYERERWLASKGDDRSGAIVWRATTNSADRNSDLRSVIDYLLVATFEELGEDTGQQKPSELLECDKRVKQLRASYKQAQGH